VSRMPDSLHQMIEAYVDGLLPEPERLELERLMRSDPAVAAQVEAARRLEDSLRRRVVPPRLSLGLEHAAPVERGAAPAPRDAPAPLRIGRVALIGALAAGVVLAAAPVVHFLTLPEGSDRDRWLALTTPEAVYRVQVEARGFEPEWICETDEEFAAAVEQRLGRPLLVRQDEPGISVLGWAYADGYGRPIVSNQTMVLLVRVGDDPVLVFMDRAEADRPLDLSGELGLKLFRSEADGLVLYELTPRSEPAVLGLFFSPEGG
jgi:hypothetical protein